MSKITEVKARQVLDCKGRPVAEVDVVTESGFLGRAGASTGSSVGANESFGLRPFWGWTSRTRRPSTGR